MRNTALVTVTLPLIISALALMDGVLHLSLDQILFRGNFVGPLGPPPGAPPGGFPGPPVPMPLQLNQMFVANFVFYVVLVGLLWMMLRASGGPRPWVDVPLIVLAVCSMLAWLDFGRPNPMGLGLLSKSVEVVLVIVLLTHARLLTRVREGAETLTTVRAPS